MYFSEAVLGVVRELLGVKPASKATPEGVNGTESDPDSGLTMELFNLLVSPTRDFSLRWHRDDITPDVSLAEEERLLAEKSPAGAQSHAQYNIALFEDASLIVVPGSHRRVRTEEERTAGPEDELPGQVAVRLGPGDVVFYDSNILHRGVYKGVDGRSEQGRMTLHGSVGRAGVGGERARQVLQHGVGEWIGRAKFQVQGGNGVEAEEMRKRLVGMGRGGGVGVLAGGIKRWSRFIGRTEMNGSNMRVLDLRAGTSLSIAQGWRR